MDSAATYNFVLACLLPGGRKTEPREVQLGLHGEHCLSTATVIVDIVIWDITTNTNLLEVPGLQEEILLGHYWLMANHPVVDYRQRCIHISSESQQTVFGNAQSARARR